MSHEESTTLVGITCRFQLASDSHSTLTGLSELVSSPIYERPDGRYSLELCQVSVDADASESLIEAIEEFANAVDALRQTDVYSESILLACERDIQISLIVFDSVNASVRVPDLLHAIIAKDDIDLWISAY